MPSASIRGAANVGGQVWLGVPPVDRPAQRVVLVLWAQEDTWALLTPRVQAEEVRVSDLVAHIGPDSLSFPVTVPGPPGQCRLVAAFPPADTVRWELPEEYRWEGVQQAIANGDVPLSKFKLHVVG